MLGFNVGGEGVSGSWGWGGEGVWTPQGVATQVLTKLEDKKDLMAAASVSM